MSAVSGGSGAGRLTGSAGAAGAPGGTGGVTLARVVRGEWTKLWSLRSTRWAFAVAFLTQAGIGPLFAVFEMQRWNQLSLGQRLFFPAIDRSLAGFHFAQLAIGVLGVLVISGEYSTGQIRSSLLAVPKRLPVLWAKMLVFATVTFALILAGSFIAFFSANAIFVQHHVNAAIGAPDALRAVIGNTLYVTATGVLCTAFGTIIRSTAGGISTFVGILFVLPPVLLLLPTSISDSINPYLPSVAGETVAMAINPGHAFSPWGGFALFCGYVVLTTALAAYLLRTRDA
jgi:ABC-2 type transport system permease protein